MRHLIKTKNQLLLDLRKPGAGFNVLTFSADMDSYERSLYTVFLTMALAGGRHGKY